MNKIYKVIYSKARNCYVVVSEFAKTQGKSKHYSFRSKKQLSGLILASLFANIFTVMPIQAAVYNPENPGSIPQYHWDRFQSSLNRADIINNLPDLSREFYITLSTSEDDHSYLYYTPTDKVVNGTTLKGGALYLYRYDYTYTSGGDSGGTSSTQYTLEKSQIVLKVSLTVVDHLERLKEIKVLVATRRLMARRPLSVARL